MERAKTGKLEPRDLRRMAEVSDDAERQRKLLILATQWEESETGDNGRRREPI